jgi:hypothetical protein
MTAENGHTKALVWTLAALFGTILAAMWVIFEWRSNAQEERLQSLEATRLEAAHSDGEADVTRANAVRDVEHLKNEDKALDDRLQREMRDLNSAIIAESRAVDARLQGEISNLNAHFVAHEEEAIKAFDKINALLSTRAERLTALEERMIALERQVYGPELSHERK